MTDEEIAVKLEGHEHEIGSLKHRMEEQEEQNKVIQDLVMSVQKLALTMEAMVKEQSMQGERLKNLRMNQLKDGIQQKNSIYDNHKRCCRSIGNGAYFYDCITINQIKEDFTMKNRDWKEWIKRAGVRALKTVAQTFVATVGSAAVLGAVNWPVVFSASALAGILSLATSVAGLPELPETKPQQTE